MTRVVVLGGTGYTGTNIVREAVSRGLEVTSWSRNVPQEPLAGVTYETGSLLDDDVLASAVSGGDVIIASLAPRGELEDALHDLYLRLAEVAAAAGTRLGVVGGFSSLRPAEGAERIAFAGEVPPQFAAEARVLAEVIEDLNASAPAELDWFFISPAADYGSYAPGEAIGTYRVGGEIAFFDEGGRSAISGADFAIAIVDEIVNPKHSRAQFSVAY